MSNYETLEQALLREYTEKLKEKIKRTTEFLASGGFENEAQARQLVGQINAYKEDLEEFRVLIKAFFPT